jgi:hypothetical protein
LYTQYQSNGYDSLEAFLLSPWVAEKFKLCYVVFFIFVYVFAFLCNQSRFGHFFLNAVKYSLIVRQGKVGLFLLYRQIAGLLYCALLYLYSKSKFFAFIVLKINDYFIYWRPVFRKVSYYGMFHASQAKWFLKNFNKK